jgi:6,7-dimethyl-8-ribityllumazine synthase
MIAIVKSNFNQPITDALLASCKQTLESNGVDYKVFEVPGAIETVGTSKRLLSSPIYKAIIVIGAVIKGDTDHYDYVCNFVTQGLTIGHSHHFWYSHHTKRRASARQGAFRSYE